MNSTSNNCFPTLPEEDEWWVYLLRCSDGTLYCGITKDLERRLKEHHDDTNRGSKYVRARLPARPVHAESHPTKSDALKREAEIKSMSRARKQALIESCPDLGDGVN